MDGLMEKQKTSDIPKSQPHGRCPEFLQKALVGFQEGRYQCFLVTEASNLPQAFLREARGPIPPSPAVSVQVSGNGPWALKLPLSCWQGEAEPPLPPRERRLPGFLQMQPSRPDKQGLREQLVRPVESLLERALSGEGPQGPACREQKHRCPGVRQVLSGWPLPFLPTQPRLLSQALSFLGPPHHTGCLFIIRAPSP